MGSMEKILYRSEDDGTTIVDYYVGPNPAEGGVRWYLFPRLPRGVDVKKGDEMGGLGFLHDDTRQSYEDFKRNPARDLSDAILRQVVQVMEGG